MYKKQQELERRQREEEDRLINAMLTERSEEFRKLEAEEKGDWEVRLRELTSKFDSEMRNGKKSGKYKKNEDLKVRYEGLSVSQTMLRLALTCRHDKLNHAKIW